MLKKVISDLNIIAQCRRYRVSLWVCPPFLFIIMGAVIIAGMLGTALVARQFSDDPSVVIVSVSVMTAFLFMVGYVIGFSFQRLADTSRLKSEFVNIVSHQLRSPLSAIKWQLEIMLEHVRSLTGDTESTMQTIKDQNERMIALVNDLLEVNRIEDDRLILRPTIVAIDAVLEEIIKEYQPRVDSAKERLTFTPKERPLWVFADESKLRWASENLLDNAIRYTKEGGEITVQVYKNKDMAYVEVADSGIGIPLIEQQKIFSQFFRAENALRLRPDGTGLGLYLVRSLVRAMSGKVGFASLEGKGSTFWFALPLVRREEEQEPKN